jgi:hypothetical protein
MDPVLVDTRKVCDLCGVPLRQVVKLMSYGNLPFAFTSAGYDDGDWQNCGRG